MDVPFGQVEFSTLPSRHFAAIIFETCGSPLPLTPGRDCVHFRPSQFCVEKKIILCDIIWQQEETSSSETLSQLSDKRLKKTIPEIMREP